jgi:hypothetical protein
LSVETPDPPADISETFSAVGSAGEIGFSEFPRIVSYAQPAVDPMDRPPVADLFHKMR